MSSEEEIYRSVAEELRQTMNQQQRAYARTNQMAVNLVKINVVTLGATIAGVSLSGAALRLPLIGGVLTFSYVRETVRSAFWASVATIAFFGAVTIRQLLSSYPPSFDLVLFVGVSTVVIWRWNRTTELRS